MKLYSCDMCCLLHSGKGGNRIAYSNCTEVHKLYVPATPTYDILSCIIDYNAGSHHVSDMGKVTERYDIRCCLLQCREFSILIESEIIGGWEQANL